MHGMAKVKVPLAEQEKKKRQKEEKARLYRIRMDRILLKRNNGEYDDEAIQSINDVLLSNPDIATLWNYKREILLKYLDSKTENELKELLNSESKLTDGCLRVNPKSYCAWHHRKWLLTKFPNADLENELRLCTAFLKLDDRNFHCWDYRRWVVSKLNIPPSIELDYTMKKIEENFSNYSSWHYRSKLLPIVHPHPKQANQINEATLLSEVELVLSAAFTDPNDQSAWFYQRWLLGVGGAGQIRESRSVPIAVMLKKSSDVTLYVALSAPSPGSYFKISQPSSAKPFKSLSPYLLVSSLKAGEDTRQVTLLENSTGRETEIDLLSCNDDGSILCWCSSSPKAEIQPMSDDLVHVLSNQVNDCNELLQLEPDSKWTLLNSANVMLKLDKSRWMDEVLSRLEKLKKIDPLRISYYCDFLSGLKMEKTILDYWSEIRSGIPIPLHNLELRSLSYSHWLLLARSVDLSNNQLTESALPALSALRSCKELKLDGNRIKELKRFPSLDQLEILTLDKNCLECDVDEFTSFLKKLSSLSFLSACDNPSSSTLSKCLSVKPNLNLKYL